MAEVTFFFIDTLTSAVADTSDSTKSSPTPKAHDMAYDKLLNQVSNDP